MKDPKTLDEFFAWIATSDTNKVNLLLAETLELTSTIVDDTKLTLPEQFLFTISLFLSFLASLRMTNAKAKAIPFEYVMMGLVMAHRAAEETPGAYKNAQTYLATHLKKKRKHSD